MAAAVRNLLIFVLLTGAATATWLLSLPELPDVAPQPAVAPAKPGYYLRDAVILGTEADGVISYRILAGRVEQPQHERSLFLTDVRVEYDVREGVPWLVTAAHGTGASGSGLLKLSGVQLRRGAHSGDGPIVVETKELEFDPETYIARAAAPVTLSSGGATLEARGFSADLKRDRVDLESGHGKFDR